MPILTRFTCSKNQQIWHTGHGWSDIKYINMCVTLLYGAAYKDTNTKFNIALWMKVIEKRDQDQDKNTFVELKPNF